MNQKLQIEKKHNVTYYNVELLGNKVEPQEINFKDTRTLNILGDDDACDYKCSIQRFILPLSSIPIMTFPTNDNDKINGTPNNNFYKVTIKSGISQSTLPVVFTPQNFTYFNSSGNLLIFSIEHFISMINKTLYDLAKSLSLEPPFLHYDVQNKKVDLYAPKGIYDSKDPNKGIFFNQVLYQKFENFPNIFDSRETDKRIKLLVKSNGFNVVTLTGDYPQLLDGTAISLSTSVSYYKMEGTYNSLGYMYSIKKILFTTSEIPIKNELLSNINGSSSNNNLNIITDFLIPLGISNSIRGYNSYFNKGERRYIVLKSCGGIFRKINISVFFEDFEGNKYPLKLGINKFFSSL